MDIKSVFDEIVERAEGVPESIEEASYRLGFILGLANKGLEIVDEAMSPKEDQEE